MVYYVGIAVLLAFISLTACQRYLLKYKYEANKTTRYTIGFAQFPGASPACQEAQASCTVPPSSLSEVLEIARNTELTEYCRKARKALSCLQGLVGEKQCSDLDPENVKLWKQNNWPILEDSWKYICETEFENFNVSRRCLLTEELVDGAQLNCSTALSAPETFDCFERFIEEQCGSTASQIAKRLLKWFVTIKVVPELVGILVYEAGKPPVFIIPQEHANQKRQTILKKLLNRK